MGAPTRRKQAKISLEDEHVITAAERGDGSGGERARVTLQLDIDPN